MKLINFFFFFDKLISDDAFLKKKKELWELNIMKLIYSEV
jgi:hypothetical protein